MRKNRLLKIVAILLIHIIFVSSIVIYSSINKYDSDTEINNTNSLDLIPISIGSEGSLLLEDEAGISAYTNVGDNIELSSAKDIFRTIEAETSDYIIGSVPIPEYSEEEDVHCYVDTDGWIVSYYLKDDPAAKIVDWAFYTVDEQITSTKLSQGINEICSIAGVLPGDIQYYDFRYPNANGFMIIVETILGGSSEDTDSFEITLPTDFIFYEHSFLLFCSDGTYSGGAELEIDDNRVGYIKEGSTYDFLQSSQLTQGVSHTIKLDKYTSYYNANLLGAIALIYKE